MSNLSPLDHYNNLTQSQRYYLQLFAVSVDTISRVDAAKAYKELGFLDTSGRPVTQTVVIGELVGLEKKGFLERGPYSGFLIGVTFLDIAVQDALRGGTFAALAAYLRIKYRNYRPSLREIRIAFYTGEVVIFQRLRGDRSTRELRPLTPFNLEAFALVEASLQFWFLADTVRQVINGGLVDADAVAAFEKRLSVTDVAPDNETLAAVMPAGKGRSKLSPIGHLPALLYVLLLMKKQKGSALVEARSVLSSAAKLKTTWYPGVIAILVKTIGFMESPTPPATFVTSIKNLAITLLESLVAAYITRWLLTDDDAISKIDKLPNHAITFKNAGLTWFAAELKLFTEGKKSQASVSELTSEKFPSPTHQKLGVVSLVDWIKAEPVWKRTLVAIAELGGVATPKATTGFGEDTATDRCGCIFSVTGIANKHSRTSAVATSLFAVTDCCTTSPKNCKGSLGTR